MRFGKIVFKLFYLVPKVGHRRCHFTKKEIFRPVRSKGVLCLCVRGYPSDASTITQVNRSQSSKKSPGRYIQKWGQV